MTPTSRGRGTSQRSPTVLVSFDRPSQKAIIAVAQVQDTY